jgi:hypothetical protein
MRRALARVIQAATMIGLTWAVGSGVRGPYADGMMKDLAVGAGVIGTIAAVTWAEQELRTGKE